MGITRRTEGVSLPRPRQVVSLQAAVAGGRWHPTGVPPGGSAGGRKAGGGGGALNKAERFGPERKTPPRSLTHRPPRRTRMERAQHRPSGNKARVKAGEPALNRHQNKPPWARRNARGAAAAVSVAGRAQACQRALHGKAMWKAHNNNNR